MHSASFIIKETESEPLKQRFHIFKIVMMKKLKISVIGNGVALKLEFFHTLLVEIWNDTVPWKKVWQFFRMLNTKLQ